MLPQEINNLSDDEKLQLISEIWDSIEHPNKIPVTDEQKKILDSRLKKFGQNPVTHKWEDVKHLLDNMVP